jgi:hypothetical protein
VINLSLSTAAAERFWSKVQKRDGGCWEWQAFRNADGYGRFGIAGGARPAHRIAYANEVGAIPKGMQVLHACDNPACVNPEHLWLGTHNENMADRTRKGRQAHPRGSLGGNARLTEGDIPVVRSLRAGGRTIASIASSYGVTEGAISHILLGRTWTHVPITQQAGV